MDVPREVARRFLLGRQALWPGRRWRGMAGHERAMRTIGTSSTDTPHCPRIAARRCCRSMARHVAAWPRADAGPSSPRTGVPEPTRLVFPQLLDGDSDERLG